LLLHFLAGNLEVIDLHPVINISEHQLLPLENGDVITPLTSQVEVKWK
jgi:hypothetical protein